MLNQTEQDRIWSHHQDQVTGAFDLSYPRLRFLAERCGAGTRVLNIGVGTGYLEGLLITRGVDAYALDPSAATIERLQRDLRMGDRARQGYGQEMPFPSHHFDKVIMTEVLEHLPADVLDRTLDEVRRVLKPGGEFTGTVPYREDLKANEAVCPRCACEFHRWGHEQSFDTRSLSALFEQHGLGMERVYARAFADFRRPGLTLFVKAVFRSVLGRLGEPLVGPNLYFRARPRHAHA